MKNRPKVLFCDAAYSEETMRIGRANRIRREEIACRNAAMKERAERFPRVYGPLEDDPTKPYVPLEERLKRVPERKYPPVNTDLNEINGKIARLERIYGRKISYGEYTAFYEGRVIDGVKY